MTEIILKTQGMNKGSLLFVNSSSKPYISKHMQSDKMSLKVYKELTS